MSDETPNRPGELYWDCQDPDATGWSLRYYDANGNEQHEPIGGEEDASTEELAREVGSSQTGWTGKINVHRGDVPRGWIKLDGGRVVDWRAL